jgi:signal peptidase I
MPSVWRRIALGLVTGLAALVLLRTFLFSFYTVPTVSMAPTLRPGDWIFVLRRLGEAAPARGEIVVFRQGGESRVKRVIGLPGDVVAVRGGSVVVNGSLLANDGAEETTLSPDGQPIAPRIGLTTHVLTRESAGVRSWFSVQLRDEPPKESTWKVPENHVFVLGDNRSDSQDSRSEDIGAIPLSAIEGRVWGILWPRGREAESNDR